MEHSLDLQLNFHDRLLSLDPEADKWVMGYSWQYKVTGRVRGTLPHPGSWTAAPRRREATDSVLGRQRPGGDADVIAGPVAIPLEGKHELDFDIGAKDAGP